MGNIIEKYDDQNHITDEKFEITFENYHYESLDNLNEKGDSLKKRIQRDVRMAVWNEYEKLSQAVSKRKKLNPIVISDEWRCSDNFKDKVYYHYKIDVYSTTY